MVSLDAPAPPAPATRALLVVASLLLFVSGGPLVGVPTKTDEWFAWTIPDPLTAMLLGGLLIALAALGIVGAVAERWVDGRVVVAPIVAASALALTAALIEADSLHEDWTWWAWVSLHAVVVVLALAAPIAQRFEEGGPTRREDAPPPGFSALVAVDAAALLAIGLVLVVDPDRGALMWPWPITPIDSRSLGAVIAAFGAAAAAATFEGEPKRLRPFAIGGIAAAIAVGVTYLRDLDGLDWGRPMTWLVAAGGGLLAATGMWALQLMRKPGEVKKKRVAGMEERIYKRRAIASVKNSIRGAIKY